MIRALVDFALNNRFVVITAAILLSIWGAISFHNLPVEAYPDVANNYVTVITQWPGRAAEEVEQQVSIPIEIVMNGIPHLQNLRSVSLAGLSSVTMIFDDNSTNDWNRVKVRRASGQVSLPPGLQPQIGTDWSPVGQIYFFTLHSTNPQYDVMELKTLEDWVVEKVFKSVPDVVDVASFGGPTREYQVRIDPDKLIAYGLSIGQVEQQLANNNVNGGGNFIQAGAQQINVRAVGLVANVHDIANTVITTKNGTSLRIRDIAVVQQGAKVRLGQFARARHLANGKIIDNDDVVSGIVLLRKGAESDSTLVGIHTKVEELNHGILPPGVQVVPFLDRSDLVHLTTHTVLHNLTEGIMLVSVILLMFPGKYPRRADRHPDHSFRPSVRLHLPPVERNSGEPPISGRARFRNDRRRRGGHDREYRASVIAPRMRTRRRPVSEKIRRAAHEVQRPVFYSIAIIITAYLPIFTLQRGGRAAVQADGLDGGVRAAGGPHLLDADRPGDRGGGVSQGHQGMAQPGHGLAHAGV